MRQCSRPQILLKRLTGILRTETSTPLQFWYQEIHDIEQIARRGWWMRDHEATIFARCDENLLEIVSNLLGSAVDDLII